MWLGKQQRQGAQLPVGQAGEVTIAGEQTAVWLDSERRGITLCAPGGYAWRPALGQRALVVRTQEEELCAAGVVQEGNAGLAPGEVAVYAPSGAAVKLRQSGQVELLGSVTVNGVPLEELIRQTALTMMAQMLLNQMGVE